MNSDKQLAMTGAGTLVIGGVAIANTWILVGAVALVITGAVLVRLVFRPRRGAGQ